MLWYSGTVRLKGLDACYRNFHISCALEYSTCEYSIICVEFALFNIFWLKIVDFGYILYSMSHMSDLKCFGCYEEYSEILFVPIEHVWMSISRPHTSNLQLLPSFGYYIYVWSRHNYIKSRSQMNDPNDFWRYDIRRQYISKALMHTIQILTHHVT